MRKVIVSKCPAGVWNSDGGKNRVKNVVTASEVFHFFSRHVQFAHPEMILFDLLSSQKEVQMQVWKGLDAYWYVPSVLTESL